MNAYPFIDAAPGPAAPDPAAPDPAAFEADWLALREPADRRARAAPAPRALVRHLARHLSRRRRALRVLDLGAGTGAALRALAPELPLPQRWCLVDRDPGLLERVALPPGAGAGVSVTRRVHDLSRGIRPLFRPTPDLVVASAVVDLAGALWLRRLAAAVARARAALLVTLAVDGRQRWAPAEPEDSTVLEAFAADQRRDKGLGGPALGAVAPAFLAAALAIRGYRVRRAPSDWELASPRDAALIAALAEGTGAAAACRIGEARAGAWAARRRAATSVAIGHVDLLALPPRRHGKWNQEGGGPGG